MRSVYSASEERPPVNWAAWLAVAVVATVSYYCFYAVSLGVNVLTPAFCSKLDISSCVYRLLAW
jgi:hypothetical protein